MMYSCVFFSSRRRHTRYWRDWSSDVCSSDLAAWCTSSDCHESGGLLRGGAGRRNDGRWRGRLQGGRAAARLDRKSVVEGKRGDLGGRRIIKKKKQVGQRLRRLPEVELNSPLA